MTKQNLHSRILYLRRYFFVALPVILIAAAIIVFSVGTIAQNVESRQSIEVSPPSQEAIVDPGKTTTVSATVRNVSNNTLPIKVRIENFVANGDEGQIALSGEDANSISKWSKISPPTFSLAPGETQEVTATIKIPKSGIVGGQYGSFIFSATVPAEEGNIASVAQEVGSLFLLRINGDVDERLTLKSISARDFSEYGPVPFTLSFENSGNVHVKPYGLINVTDMFGQKVADIVVPGQNVLPGSMRNIKASLDRKFLIGKYKALAIMYYGTTTNTTLTAETTFYVIPYKVILVLAAVLTLMYMMRKRLKKVMKALSGK